MISVRNATLRRIFQALTIVVFIIVVIKVFKPEIKDLYHPWQTYVYCKDFWSVNDKQGVKRVLFYTSWFHEIPWPGLTPASSLPCSDKCLISYNRCELPYSHAVVFHAPDNYGAFALRRVGKYLQRNPGQRWVLFTQENPYNVNTRYPELYNGIFNWTMTYRSDSDISIPYGDYRAIQSAEMIPKLDYAKGKDKLIAWAVSHCRLVRDKVVRKLLEFLPVTIIGKCSKLFNQVSPPVCRVRSSNCSSYLKRFKFYLAFENGMCIDYITEKYWNTPLDNNMVPVVLGSNYDKKVAIPGSYINILDFKSMKAFSEYITYLDKNDTAYNEYFNWKRIYTLNTTGTRSHWFCELCDNLYNDSLPKKVYTNFGAYWGVQSSCNKNMEKIQRLLK